MNIATLTDTDTAREIALRFLDDARGALTTIVDATKKRESATVVVAANSLAEASKRIGARVLAAAAARLAILATTSHDARDHSLVLVARSFAEVELEIERSLDRDVPLFI